MPILIRPGANMADFNMELSIAGLTAAPSAAVAAKPAVTAKPAVAAKGSAALVAAPPDQMQQGLPESTNAAVAADESPGTMRGEGAGQGGEVAAKIEKEVAAKIEKEEAEEKGQEEKEAAVAAPPSKTDIEESENECGADYDRSYSSGSSYYSSSSSYTPDDDPARANKPAFRQRRRARGEEEKNPEDNGGGVSCKPQWRPCKEKEPQQQPQWRPCKEKEPQWRQCFPVLPPQCLAVAHGGSPFRLRSDGRAK